VNLGTRSRAALAAVTPLGWLVAGGSAALWVAGVRLGWIEAVTAGLTGLFACALCGLYAAGRTTIEARVEPLARGLGAGGHTSVRVAATNTGRRRLMPFTLEVATGPAVEAFAVPGLAPAGTWTDPTGFDLDAPRRGVIRVGPATSVRGDPLGLVQRRVEWAAPVEVFVHPVTVRLAPLGHGLLRDLEGRTTNDISTSDLAFHTLREYVPGDDRRYVHWRSSAKVGTLLVRQFRDTRRTHLLVLVDGDATAYPDPAEFETAVSVGASVACRAVDDSVDVSLRVADRWTGDTPAGRSRQAVLDTCARANLGGSALAPLVAAGVRAVPEATFAVLVTGSAPSVGDLRRVVTHLPPSMPVLTVRVDPLGRPRWSTHPSLTVLTVTEIADLPGLLGPAGRSGVAA
jgi:uncharacterized protein (DUF58 family)